MITYKRKKISIKNKFICLLTLLAILFTNIGLLSVSASLDDLVILGFSDDGEMVFYTNEEIVWLDKESTEPSKSIPCNKAYFTPGSAYIYFEINGKLMASDYNQQTITTISTSINEVQHLDAFGQWLIVQNELSSEFFFDLNLAKKEKGLWSFSSSKNNCIIAENNIGNGCFSLTCSGQILGISITVGRYFIAKDGILCVGDSGASLFSFDFSKSLGLPRMDSYNIQSGHIIGTKDGKNFLISSSGAQTQIPDFSSFIVCEEIICGITPEKIYKAVKISTMEMIDLPVIKIDSEWHIFKLYKNFIVVESNTDLNLIIDIETGNPLFYSPHDSSAGQDQVLYNDGDDLIVHKLDGTLTRLAIKTSNQPPKDNPSPKIINTNGSRTTILYTSPDNSWHLARIDTETGITIQDIPVSKSGAKIICTPKDSPHLSRANLSDAIESWTFERLHEEGFLNSTPLFENFNPRSVLVVSPRNGEILEFACTEF